MAVEEQVRGHGGRRIVLNARDNAVKFNRRHGYSAIGEAETAIDVIRHRPTAKLCRKISQSSIFRS